MQVTSRGKHNNYTNEIRIIRGTCLHQKPISGEALWVAIATGWVSGVKGPTPTHTVGLNRTDTSFVTHGQRRVRTEWNVEPPTSKSIHQWARSLKQMGTLVSQTGKYP
ncbi:hypothetical protein TNCV_114601 [Trichonephila clavipes]|nr:hypothetical protein TNCV_114601 [Trichonephila clavipes]